IMPFDHIGVALVDDFVELFKIRAPDDFRPARVISERDVLLTVERDLHPAQLAPFHAFEKRFARAEQKLLHWIAKREMFYRAAFQRRAQLYKTRPRLALDQPAQRQIAREFLRR